MRLWANSAQLRLELVIAFADWVLEGMVIYGLRQETEAGEEKVKKVKRWERKRVEKPSKEIESGCTG